MSPSTVYFYGEWDQTLMWLRKLQLDGSIEDFEEPLKKLGEAIKSRFIWKLKRGDGTWDPLAASTVKRKGHSKFYLEHGVYQDSIQVEVERVGAKALELRVFPDGVNDEGTSYQEIARHLEYGTNKNNRIIPARPIWRPLMMRIPTIPEFRRITRAIRDSMKDAK